MRKGNDKGNIAILVALSLTALIGFGAIVTDISLIYMKKAKLQNALDAAVLAGVQELPGSPEGSKLISQSYAHENGITLDSIQITANNYKIKVSGSSTVEAHLSKVLGKGDKIISSSAKAILVPPSSMIGAVPLSIQKQNFIYGAKYVLKSGDWDASEYGVTGYPGWFGPLELTGGGANNYEYDLVHGTGEMLTIGQILTIKQGNMSGPTEKGINERFAMDTRIPINTFWDHDRDAPQIIYLPVIDVVSRLGESIQEVKVVGFSAFFLEEVYGRGNDSVIVGRFMKTIVPNPLTGQSLSELRSSEEAIEYGTHSYNYGVYTAKLIK